MKIAFNALGLYPDHNGGAESVFLNLVKGFVQHGISKDVTYFCYPEMAARVHLLSPESTIEIVKHKDKNHLSRIDMLITQSFTFHRIYKSYKFDCILFANADIGLFRYSVPTIVIPHDIQFVSKPEKNKNKIQYFKNYISYRIAFTVANKIVAISDTDKNEIESCYPFAKNKVVKIYDPIDFSYDDISIFSDKANFIFAVNIQYPHKNIETLLEAFAIISNNHPDFTLKLAGAKNDYTNSLEKMASDLKLHGKVEFLGYISRQELIDLWSTARLYVNPSLYEGFGMTSVESILAGAPTLLGDLEVNREVTDNLADYYSSIDCTNDLVLAIEKMLNTKYDIIASRKKAEQLVEKYSIYNITKQYLSLIDSLMV